MVYIISNFECHHSRIALFLVLGSYMVYIILQIKFSVFHFNGQHFITCRFHDLLDKVLYFIRMLLNLMPTAYLAFLVIRHLLINASGIQLNSAEGDFNIMGDCKQERLFFSL